MAVRFRSDMVSIEETSWVTTRGNSRAPRPTPDGLDQSLLVERENRVNPGGSQRWDQARDYGNHNEEQRCSRYAYGVRRTDLVQQRGDQRSRRKGNGEPGGDPR